MKRETQNILLVLLGGALVKIALNGDYLRYVKPAQQPWVIIGGAVMVLLGAVAIVRDLLAARAGAESRTGQAAVRDHAHALDGSDRGGHFDRGRDLSHGADFGSGSDRGGHFDRGRDLNPGAEFGAGGGLDHGRGLGPGLDLERGGDFGPSRDFGPGSDRGGDLDPGGGHDHEDHEGHAHSARPAWLLLVPVLAVFLVAPPALGADSVIRTESRVPASAAAANSAAFPPLPAGNVVPLAVNEFVSRAGWDAAGTLDGRTVSLTGFVVHTGGSTLLARLVISCCAADAFPVTVRLRGGEADHLASDAWIQVTGEVVPHTATKANSYTPDFTPASVTTIPAPKDPYEY